MLKADIYPDEIIKLCDTIEGLKLKQEMMQRLFPLHKKFPYLLIRKFLSFSFWMRSFQSKAVFMLYCTVNFLIFSKQNSFREQHICVDIIISYN